MKEKFQIDLFCLWFEYMIQEMCKFHNFFQFYDHQKFNWIIMMKYMFIIFIRPTPFSHSTSGYCMKIFTSNLKDTNFPTFNDIVQFLLCFWTGNKF